MNFTDFTLHSGLQEGLAEAGYITCMPVQEQVLQNGLDGADLYVQSQTGTGKTAAYLVTILQRLSTDPSLAGKKALVMVPTRELAVQVEEEARILGSCLPLKSASFYGGVGYGGQQDLLKKGVDIIIGTPGRVIDLQESGTMDLSQVAFLVIDEADRMFDMGFYPDLRTLIKVLPKAEQRQTMLFSATLNNWVKNLAWEYTIEAKEITIEAENITVDEIDQQLFHVSSDEKMKLLLGLIQKESPESLIVFCNTKKMSEIVAKRLKINRIESEFIIGDLPQSKRLQVIESFKTGSLRCLVATDVAARGIDVDSLAMVINYDLPNEAENYVHRIGRTARAGKTGKAYSFCSEQDVYNLPAIEKYIEKKVPSCVPGEEDFAEDKSRGVYIKTDRYDNDYADDEPGYRGGRGRDDRGRGRSGGRDGRGSSRGSSDRGRDDRGRGAGGSRSRSGEPRRFEGEDKPYMGRPESDRRGDRGDDRNRDAQRTARPDDARGARGGRDVRRQNASRDQYDDRDQRDVRDGRTSGEPDLSKLSFEDRMAYYKTKYSAGEAADRAEADGKRGGGNGEGRGRNAGAGSGKPRRDQLSGARDRKAGGSADGSNRGAQDRKQMPKPPKMQGKTEETGSDKRDGSAMNRSAGGQNRGQPNRTGGAQNRGRQERPAAAQGRNANARKPAKPDIARGNPAASASAQKSGGFVGLIKKLFGKK